jgi:pimeloyl-ACP methyl ester carboxylesterase
MVHHSIFNKIRLATISTGYYVSIIFASITTFSLLGICVMFFWIYSEFKKIIGEPVQPFLSNFKNLQKLEKEAFDVVSQHKLNIEYIDSKVPVNWNETQFEIDVHFVKINSIEQPLQKKRPIVFIHGMNTGPIYFKNILDLFSKDHDIYLMAVPGFGLVDIPVNVVYSSQKEILDFYSSYFGSCFNKHFAESRPDVVGHSFGAFLSGYFYSNNPSAIRSLVFVNGIGLVPFTGTYGKHLSIFFKMGVPLCFTRPFGNYLNSFFLFLAENVLSVEERKRNIFHLLSTTCQTNYSDIIFAKFVTTNYINSFFNYPIGHLLIGKGLNVSFVWGIDDPLIEYHIAKVFSDISLFTEKRPFRVCYLLEGGHDPIKHNEGNHFYKAVKKCLDFEIDVEEYVDIKVENKKSEVLVLLNYLQEIDIHNKECTSVFCTETTNDYIKWVYDEITKKEWLYSESIKNPFTIIAEDGEIQSVCHPSYLGVDKYLKKTI